MGNGQWDEGAGSRAEGGGERDENWFKNSNGEEED